MSEQRTLSVLSCYGAALAGPIAVAVGLLAIRPAMPAVSVTGLVVSVVWALVWVGQAWVRTDETAREAHKFAYFWGGSFGSLVGLIGLIVLTAPGLHLALPRLHGPGGYLLLGAMAMAVAQTAGYAMTWAGWWMAKR